MTTYTSPTWVDVPAGTSPPAGAPALDAANLQPLTDAVAALSSGGLGGSTIVGPKTANYTPSPGEFVLWDTTSGSLVQTLPAAPADKTVIGAKVVVLGAGHTVTVNCAGSDVFNKAGGGTSLVLSLVDQAVQLEYIAATSVWVVTGIDLSLSQLDARYAATGSGSWPFTPTAVKTSAYTAVANDLIPVDTTSGAVTVTLPAAPADKTVIAVKHVIQGAANAVTVACGGSDVFNKTSGATSLTLPMLAQGVLLQYKATGAIWYVISDDLPLAQLDSRYNATYAPLLLTQTTQTSSYTFVLGDGGTLVEYSSSSAGTFTVPPNSSVAFPIGTSISVRQYGTGLLTIAAGAGVTVDSSGGALKMGGQYTEATLTRRATNEWVLSGDISA